MVDAVERPDAGVPYIFVSYASADRERVTPVVEALQRAGIAVWLDQRSIAGGENYAREIAEGIEHAAALVLMCSAASLASRNVRQEVGLAWKYERPYLPLLLEPVAIPKEIEYFLEMAQWIEVLGRPEGEWLPSVLAALEPFGVIPTVATEAPPLAGREREQALLREKLAAANGGKGGLVLIGREAGIGKTTLADALLREAEQHGALILVGRCYDLTETPPYGPWAEIRERCLQIPGLPSPPSITTSQVTNQADFFAEVRDYFASIASARPVVLLLDDLHWADPASLDLLRFLARALAVIPLLALVTYRSDELTRRHPLATLLPLLVREADAARLDLARLSADAARSLIHARYRLADADEQRLVGYVMERAEGNALFTTELLRTLEDQGVLVPEGDGWRLGDLRSVSVPTLLKHVIDSRVGRLGEEAVRLLGVAAVIGQEVPITLWAEVAESDEETVLDTAERALDARVLAEASGGERVRFAHALIREALYEGIPAIRRRRIHRRAAEALAETRNPDPDAVGYHFQRAGDGRAVAWLMRAAERAERAYALLTAIARFEAALALMEGDAAARTGVLLSLAALHRFDNIRTAIAYLDEASGIVEGTSDPPLEAYMLLLGGLLRCIHGDDNRGLAEMERGVARLAAQTEGERGRIGTVPFSVRQALDEDGVGTLVLRLATAGRYAEALRVGEPVIAASPGRTAGGADDPPRGDAYNGLGLAYAALGKPAEVRRTLRHAAAEYRAVGHHILTAVALSVQLRFVHLAYYPTDLDDRRRLCAEIADARAKITDAVMPGFAFDVAPALFIEGEWGSLRAAARDVGPDFGGFRELMDMMVHVRYVEGDTARVWRLIAMELPNGAATESGGGAYQYALTLQRAAVSLSLDAGEMAKARGWLDAHDRWLTRSGAVLGLSERHALWARHAQQLGDTDQACEHAERALTCATAPRQPLALLAAHRLLGELDTEAGGYEDAEAHLDASLALTDACQAPYERALTLLAMAELRAGTGETDAARTLLDEVRAICEPLGAKPTLARANALAERTATKSE